MTQTFKITILATMCAVAMASNATAADRGKGGNRDRNNTEVWRNQNAHENGCAVGNTPPPGANCTNRDDQSK